MQGNLLKELPHDFSQNLTSLEWLNLNQNRILSVKTDVIEKILGKNQQNLKLISIFVNLSREEEVELILKKFPNLKYLNGMEVDREELELEEEQMENPFKEDPKVQIDC